MPTTALLAPVVLFDLDGTLVDTNYLHLDAWQGSLRAAGHDVPAARIHALIGMGGDQLLEELLGPGDHTQVKDGWRRRFRARRDEARPLPGAADLLRAVAATGAKVVIASSSEQEDVDALVALLGAEDVLTAVTTSAHVDEAKPSPEVFQAALDQADADPADAIAVGDSVWDVRAAERARLRCVGLASGGIAGCTLSEAGAVEVHAGPDALLEIVRPPRR